MAKKAILDIEISPALGFYYGKKYETNIIEEERDWFVMSFSVKILGQKKVRTYALADFPLYKKDPTNDFEVIKELWKTFNEMDEIIGHNFERFDARKANSRFLLHKLPPPSPYRIIDTLKIARSKFGFTSNKLDDLARYLGLRRKTGLKHSDLWKKCLMGNRKAWRNMKRYNAQDVLVTEDVYLKFRGWYPVHPNLNPLDDKKCPTCGSEKLQRRGKVMWGRVAKQRLNCTNCGAWTHRRID